MVASEGAAVRRQILLSQAAVPILQAVGGEGCGKAGGGAGHTAGLSVPQSARCRALPDQGAGGSRRVGMDRRPQPIHTHSPLYLSSIKNISDWSLRFFPLHPIFSHSYILYINYLPMGPTCQVFLFFLPPAHYLSSLSVCCSLPLFQEPQSPSAKVEYLFTI